MRGDWALADIYSLWPLLIAEELASFIWPIRDIGELRRLFDCRHAVPVSVCGGEFTAVTRSLNEREHREVTISVDLRASLVPGVHACMDMRIVLQMRTRFNGREPWIRAYLFPPCTHQTLSDTTSREAKELDGRRFWGILFVIWCTCVYAVMLMVEQPDTVIPSLSMQPTQRFRTSELGDADDKTINLYEEGRTLIRRVRPAGGTSGHGRLQDFLDAEHRDRYRSSWERFPSTALAVVTAQHDGSPVHTRSFAERREQFAVACYRAGIYVPADYENDLALPSSLEDRQYQFTRGKGHGRRPASVVPRSLRHSVDIEGQLTGPVAALDIHSFDERRVDLRAVNPNVIILCFVIMQATPLILAVLNGFDVIGADFRQTTHRSLGLAVATKWAESAIGAASSTFLVGDYSEGARLFATPVNLQPPMGQVVRTPLQRRRRARAGCSLAWCTLAALAGTVAYDPAARAAAACSALCGPVEYLADAAVCGHELLTAFTVGAFSSRPLVDSPQGLPTTSTIPELALKRGWWEARLLQQSIQEVSSRSQDSDLLFWGQAIKPPQLQDIPRELFDALPTFDDSRLDSLAFSPVHVPPRLDRLQTKPAQRPAPVGRCPRSIADLMPLATHNRILHWLALSLADLVCMRDHGVDCERHRPPVLVIGRDELYPWARDHIWDFRKSPAQCGFPLDYQAKLQPTLDAAFFAKELVDYPNQRILGMIEHGVVYMADVEMQGVFIPHLTSMPKGFKAITKELHRLHKLGWYDFFADVPFWPLYFNAQGSTARKLEPDRDRRTTEGGGPRKETFDRSGLRVMSINDASKTYHVPKHFLEDDRPEMRQWMSSRGLPPTPEQLASLQTPWSRGTKWERQNMPDLRGVAQDFAVLKRAGRLLNMPVYLFGDDVKDYFNHLENAPSELPLMNVVFLAEDDDLEADARRRAYKDDAGNTLIIISERRMGFGIHPNSGIAQELSEAIDYIFRRRMDARQDPINEADTRPSMQQWLAARRELESRVGGHQRRLYFATTYCDDSLIGVVGVNQAISALSIRRDITREAGLIMAIPEKRVLGVWGVWLGIAIFTSLGLIVVPKAKLIRASASVTAAINSVSTFDEYRSLIGLLEHIRHATRWPKRIMHGLYRPHGPNGASREGPSGIVRPDLFMAKQLLYWLTLLSSVAGAAFTSILSRSTLPTSLGGAEYFASSDAATDSDPPGMGGWMHGMYWYLPLSAHIIYWLHISVLEMLASGFSAIIFGSRLGSSARLTLGADALATPYALSTDSERSEMLIETHHALLECNEYSRVAPLIQIGHLRGDANLASDAVSRNLRKVVALLSKNLRLRLNNLPVPRACHDVLARVLAYAETRGVPVRPNPYQSTPTVIPASYEQFLPRPRLPDEEAKRRRASTCSSCDAPLPLELFGLGRCPSCVDYDGPRLSYDEAKIFLASYDECLGLGWRSSADVDEHIKDAAAYAQLRSLLAFLYTNNAKRPTVRAIGAVLAQIAEPESFSPDQRAWKAFGASRSNFYTYRQRLCERLREATEAFDHHLVGTSSSSFLNQEVIEHMPGRYSAAVASKRLPSDAAASSSAKRSRLFQATHAAAGGTTYVAPLRATPPARTPPADDRMPTVMVGGQRFAAPAQRKERVASARKQAMLAHAHDRANAMSGVHATDEQRANLVDAVVATHELAEFGAAFGTLDKDDHAWEYYERFCDVYGFDAMFTAEFARRCPDEVSERLAIFQAWVYPQLRGRNGRADAKPRTVFNNYVLAIIRVFGRAHVPMPKAKSVERNLAGIMRSFKLIYGVEHLMPGRKQPLTPAMFAKIEALPDGAVLRGRRQAWSPSTCWRDSIILRLGRVLWRTGHRLGEIIYHPSGEINYLTRSSVSITKADGRKIANPTSADWRVLAGGDVVLLAPCASKSDQFGEQHCPFPSVLPHDGSDTSAAAAVRDIELEQPCPAHMRRTTALFSDENGKPFTYAVLHRELRLVLTALLGAQVASTLTWHSIRIGLACSLHAADCPDAVIQLICRWSCPESLHVYRQMGIDKNIYWTEKARHVAFDATRVNNLPALDNDAALYDHMVAFGDGLDTPVAPTPAAVTPRLTESYVIPGGHVRAHPSDDFGLVGLTVAIPRSFWKASDLVGYTQASFACPIVAECDREFLHPDRTRARTYLFEHHGQYFPIKRSDLIAKCLTRAQRESLQLN